MMTRAPASAAVIAAQRAALPPPMTATSQFSTCVTYNPFRCRSGPDPDHAKTEFSTVARPRCDCAWQARHPLHPVLSGRPKSGDVRCRQPLRGHRRTTWLARGSAVLSVAMPQNVRDNDSLQNPEDWRETNGSGARLLDRCQLAIAFRSKRQARLFPNQTLRESPCEQPFLPTPPAFHKAPSLQDNRACELRPLFWEHAPQAHQFRADE